MGGKRNPSLMTEFHDAPGVDMLKRGTCVTSNHMMQNFHIIFLYLESSLTCEIDPKF